jgi:predicted dehydrogenase
LKHFCDVIRGDEEPVITAADGLMTLATTLAVLESAETGGPVNPKELLDSV